MSTSAIVFFSVLAVFVFYLIFIYNSLVALKNRFKNAFAQIDVQLKRRYDLIPNLVETSKAYLKHERETLEAVIKARNQAVTANQAAALNPADAAAMQQLGGAEAALSGALGKLFALSENYPDLKANQTMEKLMEELSSTENRIAFSRQAFNDSVMGYNTRLESFPDVIIAKLFHFEPGTLLQVERAEEREAVKVSF